jgi:chromosome partitioning protein
VIVAVLTQKGDVGKTTLARHLADRWGGKGKRVVVVDADPGGSALDWSAQPAKEALPRLFGILGPARDTRHRDAPETARNADQVVIDGPPRRAALMRSALLAADLIVIPAPPSPFDGWASGEILRLIREARGLRPQRVVRFVLNRCSVRSVIARETAEALVDPELPILAARVGRRVVFRRDHCRCRRDRADCEMTARDLKRAFAARPSDTDAWVRTARPTASKSKAKSDRFTARLTIDATPELRSRIEVVAYRRGITVAEMLRHLLSRRFPNDVGGAA